MNAAPAAAGEPLFILSCHRSGSTLLRFAVDTHPAIYCPPELFLGQAAFGIITLLAGLQGKVFEQEDAASPAFREILGEARRLIVEPLAAQTASKGKRLWCEKTPDNVQHLEVIDALFPRARYLCIYRHCLDVVQSAMQISDKITALLPFLYGSRGHLVTALIRYWTDWNGRLLRFAADRAARCHHLTYEALVSDPVPTLGAVFSFLGLDWDERLVDAIFTVEHDAGVEDFKVRFAKQIHRHSLGSGSDLALDGVPERSLEGMRALLRELGYAARLPRHGRPGAPREAETAGPGAGAPGVERLFESHLRELLRAEPGLADAIGFPYQFVITGDGGGKWVVDVGQGEPRVLSGTAAAACTVHISAPDLREMVRGRLVPMAALRDGRIRLEGALNSESLLHLLELFRRAGDRDGDGGAEPHRAGDPRAAEPDAERGTAR